MGSPSKRDESVWPRFFDLDATGAGIGLDIPNMLIAARVDDRQPPGFCIAESNVKIFRSRVVANVIGIGANRQAINQLEGVPREYLAGAVSPVGHKKLLKVRRIEQPLWLALSGDTENPLSHLEVDHFDCVLIVSQGGDKQPPAC